MFCLSDLSFIANATILHHRLNKIKHFLVSGWPKLYYLIVYLNLTAESFLVDCNLLHTFLSKLSDIISMNLLWEFNSKFLSYFITIF